MGEEMPADLMLVRMNGLHLLLCLVSPLLFTVLLRIFLFLVRVEGWSMFPTFQDGDLLLALRCWPRRRLRRGQIVVWQPPPEKQPDSVRQLARGVRFVKRITGLPGDRVTVHPLPIPFPKTGANSFGDESPLQVWDVPADHCFVQGDSTGFDSRLIGPIPIKAVRGLVLSRIRRGAVSEMPTKDGAEVSWQAGQIGDN